MSEKRAPDTLVSADSKRAKSVEPEASDKADEAAAKAPTTAAVPPYTLSITAETAAAFGDVMDKAPSDVQAFVRGLLQDVSNTALAEHDIEPWASACLETFEEFLKKPFAAMATTTSTCVTHRCAYPE